MAEHCERYTSVSGLVVSRYRIRGKDGGTINDNLEKKLNLKWLESLINFRGVGRAHLLEVSMPLLRCVFYIMGRAIVIVVIL